MINVIFVCYGNICRSPLAEFLFRKMTGGEGYKISSAATSDEEIGEPVYYAVDSLLKKIGVDCSGFHAHRLTKKECDAADYIIGMEDKNVTDIMRICGRKNYKKVKKLLDFAGGGNVSDPWYTRDFDTAFADITRGLKGFWEATK